MTHPRHLPPTAIATIIEMANGGAGWDEILAVIGCSQNTAYRHLKAAGAPRPPQRRRTKPDEEENDGEDYNIRSYRPNGELYDPYTEGRWLRCMEKMAPARDETSGGQRGRSDESTDLGGKVDVVSGHLPTFARSVKECR